MKIVYIKPTKTKRVRIGVENSGCAESYSISEATYNSLSLVRGRELDDGTRSEIIREDTEYRALSRALYLLSYGDNTKSALYSKLIRAGFSREVASETVRECVRLGYIDEIRQLRRAVELEANRSLSGKERIVRKLTHRGYKLSDVLAVIDELVGEGCVDFERNFKELCEKRGADDDESRRRLAYKHGYGASDLDD